MTLPCHSPSLSPPHANSSPSACSSYSQGRRQNLDCSAEAFLSLWNHRLKRLTLLHLSNLPLSPPYSLSCDGPGPGQSTQAPLKTPARLSPKQSTIYGVSAAGSRIPAVVLLPGLREEMRQASLAGPKEQATVFVVGQWGHPADCGRPSAAEQRAFCITFMAPAQAEHLPCCTENKLGVLTVPRPLQLSSLIALPLPPLDSCFPADFDFALSLIYQKALKRAAAHVSGHVPSTLAPAFHRPSTGTRVQKYTHEEREALTNAQARDSGRGPKPWEGAPSASHPSVPQSLVQ